MGVVVDRLSHLEVQVEELSRGIREVERRLATLEERARSPGAAISPAPQALAVPEPSAPQIASGVSLIGRTVLVLGGAYLLRALTDTQILPLAPGVALGFVYSLAWIYLADRAAGARKDLSAVFHGAAAAIVAFPLLWESASRFKLLSPALSALGISLVAFLGLVVARRRRLLPLAWISTAGAILTSLALAAGTRSLGPFALLLVVLAVSVFWLVDKRGWSGIVWAAAGAADLIVLVMTLGITIGKSTVGTALALAVQLGLFSFFVGSFFIRILARRQPPGVFEAAQTAVALLLGYGGALAVAGRGSPATLTILFLLGLALAAFCYRFILSQPGTSETPSAWYFSGAALLTLLVAGAGALENASWLWSPLALLSFWAGARLSRLHLGLQGATYILAAAVSSDLLTVGAYAFLARSNLAWPSVSSAFLATLGVAALCARAPATASKPAWWGRVAKVLALSVVVFGAGALLLTRLAPLLAGADAAWLAATRTAVLALAVIALALASRRERFREASWLVYPVLLAGGIKLLIEDFPSGRPSTLFVALAFYGGALVAAPLLRVSSS